MSITMPSKSAPHSEKQMRKCRQKFMNHQFMSHDESPMWTMKSMTMTDVGLLLVEFLEPVGSKVSASLWLGSVPGLGSTGQAAGDRCHAERHASWGGTGGLPPCRKSNSREQIPKPTRGPDPKSCHRARC